MHTPLVKHLVLVGGGHAHAVVLKQLAMKPIPGLKITLVARDIHTPYSGMLPGYIAGLYRYDDVHIDLGRVARAAGISLVHAAVEGIDPHQKRVFMAGRPALRYDLLSINTGSRPATIDTPGALEHALVVKPIDTFLQRWEAIRAAWLVRDEPAELVVVGAGASGVELSLCMPWRLQQDRLSAERPPLPLQVTLLSRSQRILPDHAAAVQRRFEAILEQRQVRVRVGTEVSEVRAGQVICRDPQGDYPLAADAVVWGVNASAPAWPHEAGLDTDTEGFIRVNDWLRTPDFDDIFATGDVASLPDPRPKSGVFAVRQGPVLAHNLRAAVLGKPLRRYRPQRHFLGLISTGNRYAVASRGRWSAEGAWLWCWKDHIDRRFMRMFEQLSPMAAASTGAIDPSMMPEETRKSLQQHAMRCGGCGAKVASAALERVLQRLAADPRFAAALDPGVGDDAAVLDWPQGQQLLQSVDYFRALVSDPYRFGAIAANHAMSDVYAMGGRVHSALAIATLPFASEALVEEMLHELLAGACSVLAPAGGRLLGGHSSEGAELAFGLSVNGLVDSQRAWRKQGAQPGDVLILTKALGTGALMAADMQAQALGRDVEAATVSMLQSSRDAVTAMQAYPVHAATDITGFGLAGHLLEMLRASACSASLSLAALPLLDGAVASVAAGIVSSLQSANLRALQFVDVAPELMPAPALQLVFDPQTSGGLLLAVAPQQADAATEALRQAGYGRTQQIGSIEAATGGESRISLLA